MILPIFLTNRYLSVNNDDEKKLVRLTPIPDAFTPLVSNARVREVIKDAFPKIELESDDFTPIVVSIATDEFDIETIYSLEEITDKIPFPVIVPEFYYNRVVDMLPSVVANDFLNHLKYGLDVPEDIKIQVDSSAISVYIKENIGKFIDQSEIIISTADVDEKFKKEYVEAMVKALSDGIQIAGVWKVFVDSEYSIIPKAIKMHNEGEANWEALSGSFDDPDGKLIIAPGITELEIGEGDNFENIDVSDNQLNKFKIKPDDKVIFKWKSGKSKFEGEIYGSKTGIRLDARERNAQK